MGKKKDDATTTAPSTPEQPQPADDDLAEMRAALLLARQRVRPIVKREREAEQVSADLLNLRLKSRDFFER